MQPVKPMGPPQGEPTAFQFWYGQNLLWQPRADSEYSASDLKELSRYPLARIAIDNVKDTLIKAAWEIQLRPQPGESRKAAAKRGIGDKALATISRFFEMPDREHVWPDWVRTLLEDMLVIDAASILIRKTRAGEIVELPVMRGEMFVRYIDAHGYTPMPPEPAYAQNWWGLPYVDLTTDQLVYKPRNIVPRNTIASQLYGMAPTESLAPEIELGRMRLAFNLAYYKEGSIPGVVQVVPRGTPPDKIAEAMQWMNSDLAGNLAERRQWRMVQGFNEPGKNDQILFPKEPLLSDPFDDNHIRKIAYGYGISPQRLMKMIRTEGKASQEAADIEGLMPYVAWLKSVMDYIIQRKMGYMDYEMVFEPFTEPDPEKQSTTTTTYVKSGVLTINEAREKIGEEPSAQPEANQLGIVTGSGFVVLGQQAQPKGAPEGEGNEPPKKKPGVDSQTGDELEQADAEAKPPKKSKPNGHGAAAEAETKVRAVGFAPGAVQTIPSSPQVGVIFPAASVVVEKKAKPAERKPIKIDPARLAPQSILARQKFVQILDKKFKSMRRKTVKGIAKALSLPHAHLAKAWEAQTTQQILDSLAAEWLAIADSADEYLTDAALAGAGSGALQLEISDEGMLGGINTVAQNWASQRAAELVGMKRVDGELVENPNAKWAISDTTRDKIKEIVTQSFEAEPKTLREIEDEIDQTGIFSDVRASTIARNEIARAQTQGNFLTWKQSGMVETVNIVLSADHDKDDECDDAASGGPYPIDEAPDVPLHVNCLCSLVIGSLTGEGEDETEKLAKYSESQERVPAGEPGGGEFAGDGGSERAARAKAAYNPATAEKQRLADKEEKKVAETIGGERTPDNSPFDVTKKGHAVEVKTVVDAKADKVTMRKECMERKVAFAKKNKMASHTVIIDTRGSKIAYYYHKGVGSFRFGASGSAEKVSLTRLKELIR